MLVELCLVLCALAFLWKVGDSIKYAGYPPGPPRLPLLGNLVSIALNFTGHPPKAFEKLAEKYGEVMFIKMGMMETVFVSSLEAVTEVLQCDAVLDRHMIPNIQERLMFDNFGIVFSIDPVWQTMRRYTIRTLREFGFGKSASMEDAINEEVEKFEKHFRTLVKKGNGVVHFDAIFDMPILNVMWRLVTGKSYELDDKRMTKLLNLSHDYMRSTHMMDISLAYPVLRRCFPGWTGKTAQLYYLDKLKDFFTGLIKEHKDSGTYLNSPECFIDAFLAKMEKDPSDFTHTQLVYVLLDLFQGSSDTTSGALEFAILHMILNPQVQHKVRKEINSVLSSDSSVTTAIKQEFPYTNATILESLRCSTLVSFSIPRNATKDVVIKGHKIKKGTSLTMNFEAVHHQKSVWGDPEEFRPERFLSQDGTRLDSKVTDNMVAFSGGKRVCLGQALGETTLFIAFVNMIRHFEFKKVANQSYPLDPKLGFTNIPQPFDVCVMEI